MSNVESICGEYPTDFVKTDIASDPSYVFVNDPNYSARKLFDSEGSTVFVNSFIECEHYVNGTWNYYPGKDEIVYLGWINSILFFSIFSIIVFNFVFKRKRV